MNSAVFGEIVSFSANLQALEQEIGRGAPRGTLSPLQERLLLILHIEGAKSVSSLAECLSIAQPNASREAAKLQEQGLLDKQENPHNRREVFVSLSAKGQELVAKILDHMAMRLAPRIDRLKHKEKEAFRKALAVVAGVLFDPPPR